MRTGIRWLIFLALLAGCGHQQTKQSVIYDPNDVRKIFSVKDDPAYLSLYNSTAQCIVDHGFPVYTNHLNVVELSSFPLCDGESRAACVDASSMTMYINCSSKYNNSVLKHEFIHALTLADNSYHDKEPFLSCSDMYIVVYLNGPCDD